MNSKWYADEHARRVHAAMSEALRDVIAKLCPGYELSHMGINRNDVTEEVQIRLHLNPLGRVKVRPDCVHDCDHVSQSKALSGHSKGNLSVPAIAASPRRLVGGEGFEPPTPTV